MALRGRRHPVGPDLPACHAPAVAALQTDLYELTMVGGYFHQGRHRDRVTFELFVRELPPHRRYLLFAGLDRIIAYLTELRFTPEELDYLAGVPALKPAMTPEFRRYLADFRFTGDVWGLPEGSVFFAGEPVLRVSGPLAEVQLVETYLLSVVNSEALAASKAARVVTAAGDAPVLEFGSRRTSPEEAVRTARAAYLAGFASTSNVEAGRRYGIPVSGTAAHAWTLAFGSELEAFRAQVDVYGAEAAVLLVDTYDTLQGVRNAISVAPDRLGGIRLDSGNLTELARRARTLLDDAGLSATRIVASGDLDEYEIERLTRAGVPIDAWGVGTRLVRSTDAPSLGGVYKLTFHDAVDEPRMKTSPGKGTKPGHHQVYRVTRDGAFVRDWVGLDDESFDDAEPVLIPVLDGGRPVCDEVDLEVSRKRAREQLAALSADVRALDGAPAEYEVRITDRLAQLMASTPTGDRAS
jgi:nicotinate phosphoribosyltransferase